MILDKMKAFENDFIDESCTNLGMKAFD